MEIVAKLDPEGASNDERRVRDPRIARVLAAVGERIAERWTVAKLAKVAGLSRAAFARRFAAEVGEPPLRYVSSLRIQRAAARLAADDASLAEIAAEVGYATEFALSRAFRRFMGERPGVFRRRARAAPAALTLRCRAAA